MITTTSTYRMRDIFLLILGATTHPHSPQQLIKTFQAYMELKEGIQVREKVIRNLIDVLFNEGLVTRVQGYKITLTLKGKKRYSQLLNDLPIEIIEMISLSVLSHISTPFREIITR